MRGISTFCWRACGVDGCEVVIRIHKLVVFDSRVDFLYSLTMIWILLMRFKNQATCLWRKLNWKAEFRLVMLYFAESSTFCFEPRPAFLESTS